LSELQNAGPAPRIDQVLTGKKRLETPASQTASVVVFMSLSIEPNPEAGKVER